MMDVATLMSRIRQETERVARKSRDHGTLPDALPRANSTDPAALGVRDNAEFEDQTGLKCWWELYMGGTW